MRYFPVVLLSLLLGTLCVEANAQAAPSALRSQLSLTVGGVGSVFQPDYAGNGIAESSPNPLLGFGAYADLKFNRWLQAEFEGRWLRFNQYLDIHEDNYMVGPRVPIHEFKKLHATPYAKVLFGAGKMSLEYNYAYGRFTDIAYGGGVDFQVSKRVSVRAVDFEYQQWPNWVNGTLHPYGVSAGFGYRIF